MRRQRPDHVALGGNEGDRAAFGQMSGHKCEVSIDVGEEEIALRSGAERDAAAAVMAELGRAEDRLARRHQRLAHEPRLHAAGVPFRGCRRRVAIVNKLCREQAVVRVGVYELRPGRFARHIADGHLPRR